MGTEILSPGWQERTGMDYDDLIWVETGETLTEESFNRYRAERPDGFFLMEHIREEDMRAAVLHPDVIIASDGMPLVDAEGSYLPFDAPFGAGLGHPRSAGTFGTYLRIAIDDGSLTLPQIIAKTAWQAGGVPRAVRAVHGQARPAPGGCVRRHHALRCGRGPGYGWLRGRNELPGVGGVRPRHRQRTAGPTGRPAGGRRASGTGHSRSRKMKPLVAGPPPSHRGR